VTYLSPLRTQRLSAFFLCALCGLSFGACGQKGPPLAPLVFLPAPVTELIVRRHGADVVLQFKVPVANTDLTNPADLDRIEVYAHTGPLPAPVDYVKFGTLVRSVPVKQPPKPEAEGPAGADGAKGAADQENASPDMVEQGFVTGVSETLAEEHTTIGPMPFQRVAPAVAIAESVETPGTVNEPAPIMRYYTVVGVSRSRNRRGSFTPPVGVPMVAPPETPRGVTVTYTAERIAVQWTPVAGETGGADPRSDYGGQTPAPPKTGSDPRADPKTGSDPRTYQGGQTPSPPEPSLTVETEDTVQGPPLADAVQFDVETPGTVTVAFAPPAAPVPPPPPSIGYNVYEGSARQPLNPVLLTAPSFADPNVVFGAERCFAVRRAVRVGTVSMESDATTPVCVTLVDTFPPAAPQNLDSVTSDGAVSLIWESVGDKDVAGYVVLRGDAASETLAPLNTDPIRETTFRDSAVQTGRSYVYAVVAVDTAMPSNRSQESNRVTQAVR
jgi:hypothetical protein